MGGGGRWGRDVTGKRSRRKLYTLVKQRDEERSLIRLAIKRNWKIKQPLTRKLNFAKSTPAIFIDWQKLDIYYKYTCEKMGKHVWLEQSGRNFNFFCTFWSETKTISCRYLNFSLLHALLIFTIHYNSTCNYMYY